MNTHLQKALCCFIPSTFFGGQAKPLVCFILGLTENGQYIKLRYYDKYFYIGPRLTSRRFALRDTCWIVGAKQAADGAMDVVFSLPLSVRPIVANQPPTPEAQRRSLDSIIAEIEKNI